LSVPATTSRWPFSTGSGSPEIIDSSTAVFLEDNAIHGHFSPGRMQHITRLHQLDGRPILAARADETGRLCR
jgi:hypothetical protein